jgi:hypothetical protein
MPKIFLKPNSAEYNDPSDSSRGEGMPCHMPECSKTAEFKAPKDRNLSEYYWFCYEHICDYNKAWDFFSGMAQIDIEDHIVRSMMWDRPTWRFGGKKNFEEELRKKASGLRGDKDSETEESEESQKRSSSFYGIPPNTPEYEALGIMNLSPPLDLDKIKRRYKELAKKHHPDRNRGSKESEELLKEVNMAYTILKLAFEKFNTLNYKDEKSK